MTNKLSLFISASLLSLQSLCQINWQKGGNNAFPPGFAPVVGTNATWNSELILQSNGLERLRLHHLPTGVPLLPLGFHAVNNPLNPLPGNNLTRIGVSRDGSQPITRPLSVLHIGYDWPYSLGSPNGTAQGGFRFWQDIGTMYMAKSDNFYTGMREKSPLDPTGRTSVIAINTGPSDNQDVVISWGDNSSNNAPNPSGGPDDNLTFIYHGPQGPVFWPLALLVTLFMYRPLRLVEFLLAVYAERTQILSQAIGKFH